MVLLLLGSALSWAAGSLVGQRRAAGVSAIALAGMQLVCGGAVLLAASGLVGEWKEFTLGGVSAISWAGFAYLTLAGSSTACPARSSRPTPSSPRSLPSFWDGDAVGDNIDHRLRHSGVAPGARI